MKRSKHDPETEKQRPETNAAEQDAGADELEALRQERDEAVERWKRALADFQNFQRRSLINEREAREGGAAAVLQSVITVLDHFDLALGQKPESASSSSIIDGVRLIRDELVKTIGDHGVTVIRPEPGAELDHQVHEALGHLPAPNVAPGHIAVTVQPGYRIGERILRPAKVMITPPDAAAEANNNPSTNADDVNGGE